MVARRLLIALVVGLWSVLVAAEARAQQGPPVDTTRVDTTRTAPADPLRPSPADTLQRARPSPELSPGGAPEGPRPGADTARGVSDPVELSARDSLVIVFDDAEGDRGTLYGESQISYQDATLKARVIEMDFEQDELHATGSPSDTAQSARPVFQRGQGEGFTGEALSYNLRTQRGRVVAARTQQQEGYIAGSAVKMFEDSTLFVRGGSYTTCDCPPDETPSYSLRSDRMKVRGKWVYTGPIQLYLFHIPTPLWLPFGFLPAVEGRRSGPLPPQYGEDRRGLYLRDFGWYFAMNEYVDLQIRLGLWSQGSYEVRPLFRYRKRYLYNGSLELTYLRERIGEAEDPNFQNRHQGQLRWSHQQTISPTSDLNGNVNLVTSSDFARRNSDSYNDAVRQEISSSVRYNKNWPGGGRSFNLGASQRQQLSSGGVNMTLPSLQFSQRSFKPFARDEATGEERWYERITTRYSGSLENRYNFNPLDPDQVRARGDSVLADSIERADIDWYEALLSREKYQLATGNEDPFDFQATHNIPLNASFRIERFNLNINPNADYRSDWYISTTRRTLQFDTTEVEEDSLVIRERDVDRSVPGFYARHDFSTSLSTSTEFFGIFPVGVGAYQGVRHRVQPSLSLGYQPNFNAPFWGRTRPLRDERGDLVRDENGEVIRYDIVSGSTVRGSSQRLGLSFNLNNEFETKRVRTDTTGEEQTDRIKLLDVDLSSSYNFAADSMRLSDINLRARTGFLGEFDVTMSATLSPYALGRRTLSNGNVQFFESARYLAAGSPFRPVRLTNFRMSFGGSFRSSRSNPGQRPVSEPRARYSDALNAGRVGPDGGAALAGSNRPYEAFPNTPTGYADFGIPWSFSFNFNYSYRRPLNEARQTAEVNGSFDFNVTPLWKVNGRTGYDFVDNELATTQISINRDLGCWQMSFSWIPFGEFQSYSFSLHVKSGKLSDLLRLQLPRSGGDRLGGFGRQLGGQLGGALRGQAGGGYGGGYY